MKNYFTSPWMYLFLCLLGTQQASAQTTTGKNKGKQISPDLFGIFFEDISYAADGGLYAELVQNRSFEYTPADRREWHPFTAWQYLTKGYGYGTLSLDSKTPIHPNNPHYAVLTIDEPGQEGIGLQNDGYDGIVIRKGEPYQFSVFTRLLSAAPVPLVVQLRSRSGEVYAEADLTADATEWKQLNVTLTATQSNDSAVLAIVAKARGSIALDMISLFPGNTFHNRPNGLRADLGEAIADLKPKFMRFPGGCLVHGDGLDNMYRWKNTIGPVEERKAQRNIWNYHQSAGLGYFEYFQFCEDIGAKPLPVVPAAVSCQNSGGTWRIGGTGQKGLPLEDMTDYIQEILDLVEYANGPATSTWGAKRAAAGHPESFHLEYLAVGNEDKQTPAFRERFKLIEEAVKQKHPEITLIGTVGPFHSGEDFVAGWDFANQQKLAMVDEHYYEKPEWFLENKNRYDTYDRRKSKVYLGEYASQGNSWFNALAEGVYMTSLERNGDIVHFSSYAPLLARTGHTSWNPNLIYFTGSAVTLTPNYYVQHLFSNNAGDQYFSNVLSLNNQRNTGASCVLDSKTGDLIIKLVNASETAVGATADLSRWVSGNTEAAMTSLKNDSNNKVITSASNIKVGKKMTWEIAPRSLTLIRIPAKK